MVASCDFPFAVITRSVVRLPHPVYCLGKAARGRDHRIRGSRAERGCRKAVINQKEPASVSAVVVTFHTGDVLFDCLTALLEQAEICDVVVVDNGNDRATQARLEALAAAVPRFTVLRSGANLGFSRACNLGGRHARGEYIALVNPDLIVSDGTFAAILSALDAHPDAWLAGGRLLDPDGSEQRGGRRDVLTPWRAVAELLRLAKLFPGHPHFRRFNLDQSPPVTGVEAVPTVSGAFMVLPRKRWETLEGMDEGMFLHLEDADICLRILNAGGQVLYCGNAPVYHYRSTSDVPRLWIEWHKTLSSGYYFKKHFSAAYPGWALAGIRMALWLRFLLLAVSLVPQAAAWLWGRSAR